MGFSLRLFENRFDIRPPTFAIIVSVQKEGTISTGVFTQVTLTAR